MLEQISWKEFVIAIGGMTIAYYGVLAVASKIRNKTKPPTLDLTAPSFSNRPKATSSGPAEAPAGNEVRMPPEVSSEERQSEDTEDPEFSMLEQLADEVQVIITQYATTPGTKEELLEHLAKEVSQYPMLNKAVFRRAINNLIIKIAKQECSIAITEDEVKQVWPTLPYDSQA